MGAGADGRHGSGRRLPDGGQSRQPSTPHSTREPRSSSPPCRADGRAEVAEALHLPLTALADLPLRVVSTGLRYLVVPVVSGLADARIVRGDFAQLLERYGAQFAYVLDVRALEGRHWNNDGVLEDVATGSAAGCVGAYLARHRVVAVGEEFALRQGRFTGRPSRLAVRPQGSPDALHTIRVGGDVTMVARGTLDTLPE
ncbi:PhzF family phenazine biosynthesis protein [Streptomyces sp. UH6]|uniref:PhzF family phenazine biosynthesis protein n=1 Tax=Streptomyces sp. UH6 TaxID=2748379 RepID=UPI00280B11F1|nr:PhzF family phenazine biosynthesis protein [Streptomyces sp. UH6]